MDLRKEEGILAQKLDDATHKGRQEGKQEGILIGHQKGKIEGKIEVAKNLLKAGVSVNLIAESTGLSSDKITELQE